MQTQNERIKLITKERNKLEGKINNLIIEFEKKHKGVKLMMQSEGRVKLISEINLS